MLMVKWLSVLVTVAVVVEGSGEISWLFSLLERLEKSKQNEVLTQGGPPDFVNCSPTFSCPDTFKCCKISIGFYCCPPGMVCDTTSIWCHIATPLLSKASAGGQTNFNKERIDYRGPTGKDVLQPALKVGDKKKGQMTGDVQDRGGLASLGVNVEATLQHATQDEAGFCLPQQTICRSPIGLRCCPLPNASCCMNGLHCCRAGSGCVNDQCIAPSFATSASSDSETSLLGATSSAAVFLFNQQVRIRTRPEVKARSGFLAAKSWIRIWNRNTN
ncbi:uncharacterized protein LOC124277732 [Haliotis rubra]|uniref:uncharacterized protein LOC124277732 n=1 Tax=Haliotis rubra TaxID=36100 RepID=UPI001EE5C6CF|nr:uncharacterized protein LOC124277732 [Haliotis rubra]